MDYVGSLIQHWNLYTKLIWRSETSIASTVWEAGYTKDQWTGPTQRQTSQTALRTHTRVKLESPINLLHFFLTTVPSVNPCWRSKGMQTPCQMAPAGIQTIQSSSDLKVQCIICSRCIFFVSCVDNLCKFQLWSDILHLFSINNKKIINKIYKHIKISMWGKLVSLNSTLTAGVSICFLCGLLMNWRPLHIVPCSHPAVIGV